MRLGDYCLLAVLGLGLAMGLILALRELARCCRTRAAKKRSGRAGYRGGAGRRSERPEKSGIYTSCTHPTLSACSTCTSMEEVVMDQVKRVAVKEPDEEKVETENETPLEVVVVDESNKDMGVEDKVKEFFVDDVEKVSIKRQYGEKTGIMMKRGSNEDEVVVEKVEESGVEKGLTTDEVEKASVKGPDEEKAKAEDETPLVVVMMEEPDRDKVIEKEVGEPVVDEMEKAFMKGQDEKKDKIEDEKPLEVVIMELNMNEVVEGKVEEPDVEKDVPLDMEKVSMRGKDEEKAETKDEKRLKFMMMEESNQNKVIEGKVEESVVEEEVPVDEMEKASMKWQDEEKAETEEVEVVIMEELNKDDVVEGKIEESVAEEEVPVDEMRTVFVKGQDEEEAKSEDKTPLEAVMLEESDMDKVVERKVEETFVEEGGAELASAKKKMYIENKDQPEKMVVAEESAVDEVLDKKEDGVEMFQPENNKKAVVVYGVEEDATQNEAVVTKVNANEKMTWEVPSEENEKTSPFKERNIFRDDMSEKAEDVESSKPDVQEAIGKSMDEVTEEGAVRRKKWKEEEDNTEEVEVEKVVVKLEKTVAQGAMESNIKQEADYQKQEVQVSEDEGDGYWWDADEDLKKLEEEDEVDTSFGLATKEKMEKKLKQLAIKNDSLEQHSKTETEETEAAKEQSCWRSI